MNPKANAATAKVKVNPKANANAYANAIALANAHNVQLYEESKCTFTVNTHVVINMLLPMPIPHANTGVPAFVHLCIEHLTLEPCMPTHCNANLRPCSSSHTHAAVLVSLCPSFFLSFAPKKEVSRSPTRLLPRSRRSLTVAP